MRTVSLILLGANATLLTANLRFAHSLYRLNKLLNNRQEELEKAIRQIHGQGEQREKAWLS